MKCSVSDSPVSLPCRPSLRCLVISLALCLIVWTCYKVAQAHHLYLLDLQKLVLVTHNNNTWFWPHQDTEEPEMPAVDNSPQLSEAELVNQLEPQMPNLAVLYWQQNKHKQMSKNASCARYPDIYDLRFNKFWQVMESSNGTYNLYAAYLDVRELNLAGPTVRILTMINRLEPWYQDTFCQIWFNDTNEPVFSKVVNVHLIWNTWWANYKHGLFQVSIIKGRLLLGMLSKIGTSACIAVDLPL